MGYQNIPFKIGQNMSKWGKECHENKKKAKKIELEALKKNCFLNEKCPGLDFNIVALILNLEINFG